MPDGEVLPSLLKETTEKLMKYQLMVLTTPSNMAKPFVLNDQFYSYHQEKEQFFWNEVIFVI
ncbi:hypothetical protein BTN50_1264 [Candidatus Enterovibrio altilux]|uniref:Uncharacterized protein n=1 Tax=Candidatus Enterovibrio altilux TaxID=1927128 RepID=A0A291B9R7_9GAMM|nr:hypothetical protein BTN50_1264 [Candidatus Enterovibrio luxaltus]